MTTYQIPAWGDHFENSRSREIEHPAFVQMPNKQHGMGFQRVLGAPDGVAMFGVWCLILQTCSRQRNNDAQRRDGWLTDDGTRHGVAWDAGDLALRWKQPAEFVQRCLDTFCDPKVGWLRKHDKVPTKRRSSADRLPARCRSAADRTERDGTGLNRTEQDRTGRDGSAPATTAKRKVTRVRGIDFAKAREAIEAGEFEALVGACGGNLAGARPAEWRRDANGLPLEVVAAILVYAQADKNPIREPSGFRTARKAWDAWPPDDRRGVGNAALREMGLPVPTEPATGET